MKPQNNSSLTIKDYTELNLADFDEMTILYFRLSQDDGNAGDSNSILNQKLLLEKYAQEKRFKNPVFFVDDGISGTTFKRPGFETAVMQVKNGKAKTFIVKDLSRFGRDYLIVGSYTEVLFPERNVRFIAINDNVDSDKGQDDFSPLRNLFNEWYARDTSKKIKAVKHAKGNAGEKMCANPPYGYLKDPNNSKNWVVDPVASEVVKKIFEYCKNGLGPSQITRKLHANKIMTPVYHKRSLGLKSQKVISEDPYFWSDSVVCNILERQEYLGHTVNFKTYHKSYKSKKNSFNPKEKWKIFKNTHEAIIDQDTFDIVQKMRMHKRVYTKRLVHKDIPNLFAGLVFCNDCGSKHTFCPQTKNNKQLDHYKCIRYGRRINPCPDTHYIRLTVLEDLVLRDFNFLTDFVANQEQEFVRILQAQFEIESSEKLTKDKSKLRKLKRRNLTLDTIVQNLYEDKISGNLTTERFVKLAENYDIEQAEITRNIEKLTKNLNSESEKIQDIEKFMRIAKKHLNLTQLTPSIVNELIDKIIIHKPTANGQERNSKRVQQIDIHYRFVGMVGDVTDKLS
ncbi:recombinase family protein, partial [Pseudolactococcus hodotermopsidis]|uniref:recombinase family protein n=1 Tax=Pseudolactococcus hodotermopsidis TaxID=2709157 RepID=UPI00155206FC